MVSALLVYRAHMHPQIARRPKRSIALRAPVVSALLVHHAHMRRQTVRSPKRSGALRARVVSALDGAFALRGDSRELSDRPGGLL